MNMTVQRYIQRKIYHIKGGGRATRKRRKKRGINVKEKGRKWGDKKKLKVKRTIYCIQK